MPGVPYITRAQAATLLAQSMVAADARRQAFLAMDEDDQDALLAMASDDIDAVPWVGRDAYYDQSRRWPRRGLDERVIGDEINSVSGDDSVPDSVRSAVAIQAARRALRAAGGDGSEHVEAATARGVTSQGGGGASESYQGAVARSAWARLDTEAQTLLRRHRAAGGRMS